MDTIKDWFGGFEKGIAKLTQNQREIFFGECGKNCVQNGVFPTYKQLYIETEADIDLFFKRLNEFAGVRSEIIESGKIYNLYFEECSCHLHKNGYVNTPLLCECSKQSVLYTMQTLWKEKQFDVTICNSILNGAKECKLNIKTIDPLL